MRVLFFLHETGAYNGAWKSAYNLLCGLKEKGVDLYIITPDKEEAYNILKKGGFRVKAVKIVWNNRECNDSLIYRVKRIPYDLRRKLLSIQWWIRVSNVVKVYNPDIIHTNSSVFYLSYDMAKYYNIPHVWHIREYGGSDFNLNLVSSESRMKEGFSKYICVSKDLEKAKGLCGNVNSHVIYNGILSEDKIIFTDKKDNYFLYVGSLGYGKGIKDIIDAWHIYKDNNRFSIYTLKIVGGKNEDIIYWQNYLNRISAQNDGIEFLGICDDVYKLMAHCKGLLMGSYFEAFGRVTAEAMFCGAIVIGRNSAGTREQFENGVHITGKEIGLRFDDVETLSEQINRLTHMKKEDYELYVRYAQTTIKRLYTNEVYVMEVLRVYNSMINL